MEQWIVARAKPRQEGLAQDNIRRQGHTCYIPRFRERVVVGRNQRVELRIRSLFPGYIFVQIEGVWRWLTGTYGVSGVIQIGDNPAVLPVKIVPGLKAREDPDGFIVLPGAVKAPRFRNGQRVRVTEGPFQDRLGSISQESTVHERVSVLLDLLGRRVPVLIGEESLDAA